MRNGDLVAVYGSLRQGMGNHGVISQYSPECKGDDTISGWNMYSLGGFPYILESIGDIVVEVYVVANYDMKYSLDLLEGYPSFYDRKKVTTRFGDAWIYFMHEPYHDGAPLVDSGDWVAFKS